MMNASLARSARVANPIINANAATTTVAPDDARRLIWRNNLGTTNTPSSPVPNKKSSANPNVCATVPMPTDPPVTTFTTTVKMIRPRTSSATAAPRTIRDSIDASALKSPKTRAVIPTLVAVSAAPNSSAVFVDSPNNSPTPSPAANGTTTPTTATAIDAPPTFRSSTRSVSMPTESRSNSTPISASTATETPRAPSSWIRPITDGPTSTPATISPSTAGTRRRSASSATTFAAVTIISRSSSRRATSIDSALPKITIVTRLSRQCFAAMRLL